MSKRSWRGAHVLAVLVALALVATACADEGDSTDNETLPDLTGELPTTAPPSSTSPGSTPPAATTASTPATTRGSTAPLGDPQVTFAAGIGGEGLVKIVPRPGGATYVVAKRGQVLLVGEDGSISPALDIVADVSTGNEQGLLGLAFHPSQPLAYVNYTDVSGDTVIAEYGVTAEGALDPATRREVMTVDQPFENHNGGNLVFGPDQYLYIGLGDGGSANDPVRNALNVSSPLGKMLRIDPVTPDGFNTPADNPYIGTQGALGELWSIGLRNPWRYSFDPETGDLWIGDVGQGALEEIDVARATGGFAAGKGVNFGWSAFEGNERLNEDQPAEGVTAPYYTYTHDEGRCSVTGGVVYRGAAIPELVGWYVFADYCSGEVWAIDVEGDGEGDIVTLGSVASPVSIDQVGDQLYVVSQSEGARLVERET